MDNTILVLAICMGKSIFQESRGNTPYKKDSHICKMYRRYKIPIIFINLDLVVQL